MNILHCSYREMADDICRYNKRIIVYGAGLLGQIVVPHIIKEYRLNDRLMFYVDANPQKNRKKVAFDFCDYEIKPPDCLSRVPKNTVIMLAVSQFHDVLTFLEGIEELKDADCYIIPLMQLSAKRRRIPKIIHYCWFGGEEMPPFLKSCIDSWRMQSPDYKLIQWNDTNYDVKKHPYSRQAYEMKRYSFVSDIARLDILYNFGGIYIDTDVKLLKSLDTFLDNEGFVGTEKWGNINSGGGIGALPYHPMIREMLDYRLQFEFVSSDGAINTDTNGIYETVPFVRHGMKIDDSLQIINHMTVYPSCVFHPYDYISRKEIVKPNTVSIHYFFGSWLDEKNMGDRQASHQKYNELKNSE